MPRPSDSAAAHATAPPTAPASPACRDDGAAVACYDIAQSVGYQLKTVMGLMRREAERRMAAHGLTDAQWRPLWMLSDGSADTGHALARRLEIDAGAMTRLLDRLEAKGLIERERSDADRRVVHLRLTAAGRQAAVQVPPVLAAVNDDFLRGFSDDEWRQLLRLLERMAANGMALLAERERSVA